MLIKFGTPIFEQFVPIEAVPNIEIKEIKPELERTNLQKVNEHITRKSLLTSTKKKEISIRNASALMLVNMNTLDID